MDDEYGLIHALLLDGLGSATEISVADIHTWSKEQGVLWLHFDYSHPEAEEWFMESSGLDKVIAEALLEDETRPRATSINDGMLIALRGINHNPGAEPDDMVSLRLWVDPYRIVTSRRRKVGAISIIRKALLNEQGPKDSGDFLVSTISHIVHDMADTIDDFEERTADYEDAVLSGATEGLRYELANLRRQAITVRRYLAPERDALSRLLIEKISWIDADQTIQIREINDALLRHIENLDAARDRAAVTQEELSSRLSEQLNSRMYVLSVVTTVFLPLGFFTGLLGVNIAGIPGTENHNAFWIFVSMLIAVVIGQIVIFRWKKWF